MLVSEDNSGKELTGRLTQVGLCYQRILQQNPSHPEALLGMSLIALASRQPESAVKMARVAVSVALLTEDTSGLLPSAVKLLCNSSMVVSGATVSAP